MQPEENNEIAENSLQPPYRSRGWNEGDHHHHTREGNQGRPNLLQKHKHHSYYHNHAELQADIDQHMTGDKESTKTFSRMLVEGFLQHKKWYNPWVGKPNAPSLEKAWAYYEHFTLNRHFTESSADHKFERAEPGELKPTSLYNFIMTPESALGEFGLGVASYFTTLRVVATLLILTGCINIALLYYYASDEYSAGTQSGLRYTLTGSAICTDTEWVLCPNCDFPDASSSSSEVLGRFAFAEVGDGSNVTFVLRNACDVPGWQQGIINYAGLWFLVLAITLLGFYQQKREEIFDEEKQTATDYSLVVHNPPPDAYDPEMWRLFFNQFAEKQVVAVTVALNNSKLVHKLIRRRVLTNIVKRTFPKGIDYEDEDQMREAAAVLVQELDGEVRGCCYPLYQCTLAPILRLFNIGIPPDVLVDKIFELKVEIKELLKQDYEVSKVFVTFETEAGQRTALEALDTPLVVVQMQQTDSVPPSTLFQGRILSVEEPNEPSTIRWLELGASFKRRMIQRTITLLITCALVAAAGYLVFLCRESLGTSFSGPLTTIFNSTIPQIVKWLLLIESHGSEGGRQQSLYLKITLFRWFNTAILTKIISPFTATISDSSTDILNSINSVLWSELILGPCVRLLDIMSNLKKHFLGPRSRTQEQMNLWFQGTYYHLGERYTDFTKIMFVCFFYSALFPAAFFFGGAIMMVQYVVDKFCLMRIWRYSPSVGPQVATFSRTYFFSGALLVMAIAASYDWAQFPFDNVCPVEESDPLESLVGSYQNVQVLNGESLDSLTVEESLPYQSCDQSWRGFNGFPFPATERLQSGRPSWMTEDQITLVNFYGWSTVALVVLFVIVVFGGTLYKVTVGLIRPTYKPSGTDAQIDFQNVSEISVYVPQFNIGAFQFPALFCDVDDVNRDWIGWKDPRDPTYDSHNLIFDIPYEGMKRQKGQSMTGLSSVQEEKDELEVELKSNQRPVFSVARTWRRKS